MAEAGQLHLVLGPMFSGKTTRLMEWAFGRQKLFGFKHRADCRYGNETSLHSHTGDHMQCHYLAGTIENAFHAFVEFAGRRALVANHHPTCGLRQRSGLRSFAACNCGRGVRVAEMVAMQTPDLSGYSILIDEVHLFPDCHKVDRFLGAGCTVMAAGLSGGNLGRAMNSIAPLVSRASTFSLLRADCNFCTNKDALFTVDCVPASGTFIGGRERYKSACHRCRFRILREVLRYQAPPFVPYSQVTGPEDLNQTSGFTLP